MVGLVEIYILGPLLSTVTAFFRPVLVNEAMDPSKACLAPPEFPEGAAGGGGGGGGGPMGGGGGGGGPPCAGGA